ncbi:glycosyltransferase family 1 protein [Phlegmacium glaucopus]|nr:glycosyltransferase family 1 protein [Phlegmacium glaucopus]
MFMRIFSRTPTTKSKTQSLSDTSTDTTSVSESDDSSQLEREGTPFSQLYNEAAEFEKVLLHSGCINPYGVCPKGTTGFADLVGRDLNKCERALLDRDAQLYAVEKAWSYSEPNPEGFNSSNIVQPDIHRASSVDNECLTYLKPQDIVNIMIQEFGPVAAPGDEERLLLETDGALIHDIAVVGVIHLTTHRLAFHASLLNTRPDLVASNEALKAGPAILHRKGWQSKSRIWLELTHDALCTYVSSKDDDRMRPLCTLLLAFVQTVVPVDPKHPRILRLIIDPAARVVHDYAEFDTEESAQDWRREVTGALFTFRHLRREAYTLHSSESKGITLSCPLDRIIDLQPSRNHDFTHLMSVTVQLSSSDFQLDSESVASSQTIEIGPLQRVPLWTRLMDIVSEAKQRQNPQLSMTPPPIMVDFGPYSFFQNDQLPLTPASSIPGYDEEAIRLALGFGGETELWTTRARLYRSIACSGFFVVSAHHLGFWCKNITQRDLRYRLPISMIKHVECFNLNWMSVEGVTLGIKGRPDLKFVFKSASDRDQAIDQINIVLNAGPKLALSPESTIITFPDSPGVEPSPRSTLKYGASGKRDAVDIFAPLSRSHAAAAAAAAELPPSVQRRLPKVINIPREMLITRASLHFVCLTIGSRGDIQPYIALGLELMNLGHTVTIVTHEEYRDWIVGFGLGHRSAGGDPGALMKLSVDHKIFSADFFRESLGNFRPWLNQLLLDSWAGCRDADVLLESPSAMAGVHIAEALNIPYFRAFTMPWTKTAEFPHAFLSPPVDSPSFNSASNVMWAATSKQINKWRRQSLGIGNTDMGHMAQSKITFIYNFSKTVVPKPLDWPDTTVISGYWFLDNPDLDWKPPEELLEWMAKARSDGKPIVYIGFGSITVPHPSRVTDRIVKAVVQSDVRAIISKGWATRMSKSKDQETEVAIPPECYLLDKLPHDWLFPRIDAALHHGGAGTTGASLRAGIPTLIKPWFGDQFFWASRVQALGVGLKVPSLRVHNLVEALVKATTDGVMKEKATALGERIRAENGVHTAIHSIYTYLDRASQDRAFLDKS